MGTARDIALIFLSLEALIMALVPMVIIFGLAYGVYRLTGLARVYLRKAQAYAQQAYDYVEKASMSVSAPFIKVHSSVRQVTTIIQGLTRRERPHG
ncbi:MAG: hypothetical protein MUQ30_19205 [Anaerolineae bacterium]|nr:hypothetical protein [Anaerolineae bacterium]